MGWYVGTIHSGIPDLTAYQFFNFTVPVDESLAKQYWNAHSIRGMPGNWLPYDVAAFVNSGFDPDSSVSAFVLDPVSTHGLT